jgi:hypothetical protein
MWEILGSKNDDASGKLRIWRNEDLCYVWTSLAIAEVVSSCRGYNRSEVKLERKNIKAYRIFGGENY